MTFILWKRSHRRGFALKVNRRLEFDAGAPLALYWEVYGLTADDEGIGQYEVQLKVTRSEGGGVVATVVGALGRFLGLSGGEEPVLTFERTVELSGDRTPDYISLDLGNEEPSEYSIFVQVTDQRTGASVVIERTFRIRPL